MHKSQSLFYLTTAVHVSCVTITQLQEHKTTATTASGNRYTVIELNLLIKSTNRLVLFISEFNSIYYTVTVTRCCIYSCFVLLKMGDSDARNM